MDDIEKIWFLQRWRTPERDKVESIAEINQKILKIRNERPRFVRNDTPEFLAPAISGEISELNEALLLERDMESVRSELADVFIFSFGFSNILKIDIATEINKLLSSDNTKMDNDTNFSELKELSKSSAYREELDTPGKVAIKMNVTASRLFRPIEELAGQLKNSDKTVRDAILDDEELYKEIKEIFIKVILLAIIFADLLEIDITKAIEDKLIKVQEKHPVGI